MINLPVVIFPQLEKSNSENERLPEPVFGRSRKNLRRTEGIEVKLMFKFMVLNSVRPIAQRTLSKNKTAIESGPLGEFVYLPGNRNSRFPIQVVTRVPQAVLVKLFSVTIPTVFMFNEAVLE